MAGLVGSGEGLSEVLLDVVDVLKSNGNANHGGGHASGGLLFCAQLLVGGCRMNHQGLGVPTLAR